MEAAHHGIIEPGKTIVCGHWNSSFGHSHYEGDGYEFDDNPNFDPYYGEGIIALDACTPLSRKVNCIVIQSKHMSFLTLSKEMFREFKSVPKQLAIYDRVRR